MMAFLETKEGFMIGCKSGTLNFLSRFSLPIVNGEYFFPHKTSMDVPMYLISLKNIVLTYANRDGFKVQTFFHTETNKMLS